MIKSNKVQVGLSAFSWRVARKRDQNVMHSFSQPRTVDVGANCALS